MFKPHTTVVILGVLATSFTLTGCSMNGMDMGGGSSSGSPSASADNFNNADVTFAMEMSAHHQQAIEMAQLVLDKSGIDPKVTTLAQDIKAAQDPEIQQMKSWLAGWGQKTDAMSGMDHSGMLMPASDMTALEEAAGLDASKLFLTQMTAHHTSAIEMAKTEVDKGKNADAVALAKRIIDAQTAEISKMSDILAKL